jgi:hypothetical protein
LRCVYHVPIAIIGMMTIPDKADMPPAIPAPPVARDPPPNQAKIALVAAAPCRVPIAVPVDAVPRYETSVHVPNATVPPAAAPPASPNAAWCLSVRVSTRAHPCGNTRKPAFCPKTVRGTPCRFRVVRRSLLAFLMRRSAFFATLPRFESLERA